MCINSVNQGKWIELQKTYIKVKVPYPPLRIGRYIRRDTEAPNNIDKFARNIPHLEGLHNVPVQVQVCGSPLFVEKLGAEVRSISIGRRAACYNGPGIWVIGSKKRQINPRSRFENSSCYQQTRQS